jgi:hypothetical protein
MSRGEFSAVDMFPPIESLTEKATDKIIWYLSSLRGAKRRSNPALFAALWIASLRSQ